MKRTALALAALIALAFPVLAEDAAKPQATPAPQQAQETGYWLTLSTKTRHTPGCRYYGTTKGGPCAADAGKPCKLCQKRTELAADKAEGEQK